MFLKPKKRQPQEVHSGAMADIAFLMLIFFLITTAGKSEKGLEMRLPPGGCCFGIALKERNIFDIAINSGNEIWAEGELIEPSEVRAAVEAHFSNFGEDPDLSENPEKAIVSIITSRLTDYEHYIFILTEIKRANSELRAEKAGMSTAAYLKMEQEPGSAEECRLLKRLSEEFPLYISDAEPHIF